VNWKGNKRSAIALSNFYGKSGLVECSVSSPAHKGGTFLKNIKQISMKTLLLILFPGTFALFISSCNNTSARETGAEQGAVPIKEITNDNVISYKVNGELVRTSGWNISRFQLANDSKESLNLTTNMHEEKRTITININGTEPGEYLVKPDSKSEHRFYGSYFPDYINDLSNSYTFETGSFIITEIDTIKNILNAGFWGTAKNIKGETIDISDGKIVNGRVSSGVTKYE